MSSLLLLPPPTKRQRITSALTGVVAFLVAGTVLFVFAKSVLESFGAEKVGVWDFAATGLTLVIAGFFGWLAWSSRLGALPFRFVADAANRECGYRWGSWWTRRIDLSDVSKLKGDVYYVSTRPYTGTWRWSISAVTVGSDKCRELYSPLDGYRDEEEAVTDCRQSLKVLSEHLLLPSEFRADSGDSTWKTISTKRVYTPDLLKNPLCPSLKRHVNLASGM